MNANAMSKPVRSESSSASHSALVRHTEQVVDGGDQVHGLDRVRGRIRGMAVGRAVDGAPSNPAAAELAPEVLILEAGTDAAPVKPWQGPRRG